jgi:hypothetical protein
VILIVRPNTPSFWSQSCGLVRILVDRQLALERREVGSWSTTSHFAGSLAPLANRFGQLAYVTFVHEPLLQCTGVPKIGPLAVPLMMKLITGA